MSDAALTPINKLLAEQQASIADEWVQQVLLAWNQQYPDLVAAELRQHAHALLALLAETFAAHTTETLPSIPADSPLAVTARELSTRHAKVGVKPSDTAHYVLALKNVLLDRLLRQAEDFGAQLHPCLKAIGTVVDRISVLTFQAYVEVREKIISQQALSLVELSTPVIRLWDHVLMVPLVGVIDTLRARQFTERLLEGIARYEATVTIIDVTGVPVFDTSVARHIMKTVDAAQLLGTRIVITGISPEGAQTLTKLGVGFSSVTSRATLRAGVAEAFKMIGRRITATGAAV